MLVRCEQSGVILDTRIVSTSKTERGYEKGNYYRRIGFNRCVFFVMAENGQDKRLLECKKEVG